MRTHWMSQRIVSMLTGSVLCLTPLIHADEGGDQGQKSFAGFSGGVAFLVTNQAEDGGFGQRSHPGITALCVTALAQSPLAEQSQVREAVTRGLDNLRTFARDDGSIQPKRHGVPVYTTSVSLLAFNAGGRPEDEPLVRRGREYLLKAQQRGQGVEGDQTLGGLGYTASGRADMSNTHWAAEALYVTRRFAKEPLAESPDDGQRQQEAFQGAIAFIQQCQNDTADDENRGGVSYLPQDYKPKGVGRKLMAVVRGKPPKNYGAMTYAAMKTMVYADVDRDDPRVRSALEWIRRHFTFEENPGQGMSSYYYYIQTCAKALAALGEEQIKDADGKTHNWREELTVALLGKQHEDGSWVNEVGRHWESDSHLVTAYALLALEHCIK